MEYRVLKHTNLKVSRVSFGTMTFGSQADEAAARRMVDRAIEAGVNFFDTANVYNGGRAESILGKALAGRRSRVVVASKVRGKMGEGPEDSGLSRAAIHKAVEASLKRLETDYLDIYYLHQPDYGVPIEETLEAMDGLVRAGKVRYPAISNYAAWQAAEIHCISAKQGYQAPRISQPMYNLLARGIEEEYIPFCQRFGVGIIPYNPLAGGLLTGKYRREHDPKAGGRFDNNRMYQERYWHDDYFAAVDELAGIAKEAGKTLVELSFQWLLNQETVDSIILGASRLEQLEENLRSCETARLDSATLTRCDEVWKRLRGVVPKYNR
ncbi:MAG TPA: aldo/keto reductase [Acidobacteriaceae bacterium]|nr:aldo/keto reductase [Acidobacteriaceae bacterium]